MRNGFLIVDVHAATARTAHTLRTRSAYHVRRTRCLPPCCRFRRPPMSNGDFACGTALPSAVIGVIAHGVVVGCTARHSPQYLLTASLTSANMTTTAAARAIVMNHGASAVSPEPEGGTFARGHAANDKSRTRIDSPLPKKLDWQKKTPHAARSTSASPAMTRRASQQRYCRKQKRETLKRTTMSKDCATNAKTNALLIIIHITLKLFGVASEACDNGL